MADAPRLLAPDYLGTLSDRSVDEIRAMRTECLDYETGLSFLRRMVQGRVDIVSAEQERRRTGGDPAGLPELIGQLPEIFSEQRRPGGSGRLPQSLDVPEVDPDLVAELDRIAGPGVLGKLPSASDAALGALDDALRTLEATVSDRRRRLFDLMNALQAELTDRYRTGEASVDSLLTEP